MDFETTAECVVFDSHDISASPNILQTENEKLVAIAIAFNAMPSSINEIAPYDALGSIAMTLITIYRRRIKKMVKYFAAIEMAL